MFISKKMNALAIITLIITLPLGVSLSFSSVRYNSTRRRTEGLNIYTFNPDAQDELVIYTHESFLAWGLDPTTTHYLAFEKFAEDNGITVVVNVFSGMVDALNSLIREKANPTADVVIGLDNVMVSRAKEEEILQPYLGVDLENISYSLITSLDPEKYLLPIDYSLLAIIFDTEYITTTTYPELNELSFNLLTSTFAEDFVVQDPTLSATGLNFLLHQIIFYEEVLGLDWKIWWQEVKEKIIIDESWSASWDRVFSTKDAHMMVSYATDPAYNAYFNYSFEKNGVLIHHQSKQYGWMQIEGIGIVNGSDSVPYAEQYIDYALSQEFQDLIALNNWMFPANNEVTLPSSYDYAITTENVTVLNNNVTTDYIAENYLNWLNEWEQLIFGTGLWWLWVTIPTAIIVIALIITIVFYIRSKRLDIE